MTEDSIGRRRFLRTAGLTALAATGLRRVDLTAQTTVPNSSGTERPTLDVPPLACDCHHHIYDAVRFPPLARGLEPDARVQQYRLLQRRLGTTRNVIVTPAPYVTDNRVTLDAIAQFGSNARGVAVVHPSVSDAELKALAAGGIRGIRFALAVPPTSVPATTLDMVEPLARRAADLGWHLQFNMDPDQLVAVESMVMRLPATLVFDHMGRIGGAAWNEASGSRHHPALDGPRPHVGEAVCVLGEPWRRPARVRPRDRSCAGVRASRTGAPRVGQQLAAPW